MLRDIPVEGLSHEQMQRMFMLDKYMKNEALHGEPGMYKYKDEVGRLIINNENVLSEIFMCLLDICEQDMDVYKRKIATWANGHGRSARDLEDR